MTTTYSRFATNVAPGGPIFLRFFINISAGQNAGVYSNSMRFVGVATGTSAVCSGA